MDHYGNHLNNSPSNSSIGYPPIPQNDDFFDFKANPNTMPSMMSSPPVSLNSIVPLKTPSPSTSSSHSDNETLQQLKQGFVRMMATMERLEQRINRMEQTTSQILKNQQDAFQVPFLSQNEIEKARQVAEQLEQDTSVAKQLQAAYNKEVEFKKSVSHSSVKLAECPICGVRVNQMDLEVHVDQCLEMFSNDPKKEVQVQETKKKMETGFFGRLFKSTSTTKTETTKVVQSSATAPLLHDQDGMQSSYPSHPPSMNANPHMYPGYPYSPYPHPNMNVNGQPNMPMMMPMYMYPNYPHLSNQQNE